MSQSLIYQARREKLGTSFSRTLFLISSGHEAARSHSVRYRFKPAADFSYLCGLHLADSLLVILGRQAFLLRNSAGDALWGEHTELTTQDAELLRGLVLEPQNRLAELLDSLRGSFDRVALAVGRDSRVEEIALAQIQFRRRVAPLTLSDSRPLVGTLRLEKSAEEIAWLRLAGAASSRVHARLQEQALAGQTERRVANWVEANFLLEDMQWTAYETIVGSGERSTILHARASDRRIQNGELVLVDAGGEWRGYCADITRTLPAGERFTKAQGEIYSAVLRAQKAAIALVRPGNTLEEIHAAAQNSLSESLARLGLSPHEARENISRFMPHSTSHWIGLDVHDPAPYVNDAGEPIRLRAGMTFTVEPGLYFREKNFLGDYYGIGVRIEDDLLVTEQGAELLTHAPKEIEEIEALRARTGTLR